MFAKITVNGRLTKDPAQRTVGQNTVTDLAIAVNTRSGKEEVTTFYQAALWGRHGENAMKFLKKGSMVVVTGDLRVTTYKGKDDKDHTNLGINADFVDFQFEANKDRTGNAAAPASPEAAAQKAEPQESLEDDLPF